MRQAANGGFDAASAAAAYAPAAGKIAPPSGYQQQAFNRNGNAGGGYGAAYIEPAAPLAVAAPHHHYQGYVHQQPQLRVTHQTQGALEASRFANYDTPAEAY